MLPKPERLRRSDDFRLVMRRGTKVARRLLVVHVLSGPDDVRPTVTGFVVSKAVGNAVVRHRVTRRLRHLIAARRETLAPGWSLVVRALPPAADATAADLGSDLDSALRRVGVLTQAPVSELTS